MSRQLPDRHRCRKFITAAAVATAAIGLLGDSVTAHEPSQSTTIGGQNGNRDTDPYKWVGHP